MHLLPDEIIYFTISQSIPQSHLRYDKQAEWQMQFIEIG